MNFDKIRADLQRIYDKLEAQSTKLTEEQEANEAAREKWDEESGDPEPDEVDNQAEIDRIDSCLGHIDDAMTELRA